MPDREGAARSSPARFLPVLVIAALAAAFFVLGGARYLTFDAMKENYEALAAFVAANYWGALVLYALAYVAVVALSVPGATLMSVLGGFLFGTRVGTGAVVVAATIGATLVFLAARTAFGDVLHRRAKGFLARMEKGFSENAFSYLLLLRLIPFFPFFIVNIAAALANVRTRTFIAATLLGIIPGAFAFVSAGNGLGAVLERGDTPDLSGLLLEPEILTPIAALTLLAALPILYRALMRKDAP